MKKTFKNTNKKGKKGITLIALVITIIVLLILAGVSISMLSGDNSILSQAGRARDITGEKSIAEKVQLAYIAALANGQGEVTEGKLKDELDKEFGQDGYELSDNLTKVIIDEKEYDIGGTVTEGGTGLIEQEDGTFKDNKGNEWVWIEVPNDGTGPTYPANATPEQIETALRAYVAEDDFIITGTNSDSWTTTTAGYTDTWYDGCGLSESEYNTTKSKMLNSIKDNGGFYIGKYETGIENSYRTSAKGEEYWNNDEDYPATESAVIKQNAYPYNYVTCSQAENLAKGFATDGKTASLLFGIQWDLVLKFIKVKENLSDNTILTSNSTTWGNYFNNNNTNGTFSITSEHAMSSSDYGESFSAIAKDTVKSGILLLTTGSSTGLAKQGIYDFAGNVAEWTLEQTSDSDDPCAGRGGSYRNNGGDIPASHRNDVDPTYSDSIVGFRVALY